ncbi:hypothetical protein VTK73DRAFT_6773 [Phialemonium thermophilum]|uniref:DNA (cytosine-5-)-methyltransferase n=1 Tax=Phialemonium thermophilum TaxID=223376 RepID=A0ABR3Y8V0_9PEZI
MGDERRISVSGTTERGISQRPSAPRQPVRKWTKLEDSDWLNWQVEKDLTTEQRYSSPEQCWSEVLNWDGRVVDQKRITGPDDSSDDSSDSVRHVPQRTSPGRNSQLSVCIPRSTLTQPRSQFQGWTPPYPQTSESLALADLKRLLKSRGDFSEEEYIEFKLDNFSIYTNTSIYQNELRPLQHLTTKSSHDRFYFDGVLRYENIRHFVRKVSFQELPIGNYGTSHATVGDQIWIRSDLNKGNQVYYQLKSPSVEYTRFYEPFLWLADLAKHVVDFCARMWGKKRAVTLDHFKRRFYHCLLRLHSKTPAFRSWHAKHGSMDYRSSIVAHAEFIWKEANGVLGSRVASSLTVFKEIKHFTQYRPFSLPVPGSIAPTIVTPYILECFGHMKLGRLLQVIDAQAKPRPVRPEHENDSSDRPQLQMGEDMAQAEKPIAASLPMTSEESKREMVFSIVPGDTISTHPDDEQTGTKWRKEDAKGFIDDNRWFGLVQKVHVSSRGTRSFDVTWLYRPVDTPCCRMRYPWPNELFLSNHCTCAEGRRARWDEDEVLGKHDVDWFGEPTTTAEFFVRQTYEVDDRRWVALEPKHFQCEHTRASPSEDYRPGDTVLATLSKDAEYTEPLEVIGLEGRGHSASAYVRRLVRRAELEPWARNVRPNELVYTEQFQVVPIKNIVGRCLVRVFRHDQSIPCPYDRDGTANAFFITHRLIGDSGCVPIEDGFSPSIRQGFDPTKGGYTKLRGLDLFCGSGNFGRGLEEGGAVQMLWANDIWDKAIGTYMANAPSKTRPFLGSVDDLLKEAMEGRYSAVVPQPGEVDFISGGSPCQGFSLLTEDKNCDRQVKNQSLVASFASFIDFYRPKYGILENVPTIVQKGDNRKEDVFSQLICAIIGMGYQAQLILGDAWSYGASQGRTRVFLYFADPTVPLPEAPLPSHSHFDKASRRSLGVMSNGEPYVQRSFEPTAFKYVSAAEGTSDLPGIGDAKADCCVEFPDHRIVVGVTQRLRRQFNVIPLWPPGMNFAKAWNGGHGVMTPGDRELFPPNGSNRVNPTSKGWGRQEAASLFQTITTTCGPTDARCGRWLHWSQPRPISIMEARRAQGVPDGEVLVGPPPDQWKLIGNSVARQIALALGLQFRKAWLGTLFEERPAYQMPAVVPISDVLKEGATVAPLAEDIDSEWGPVSSDSSISTGPLLDLRATSTPIPVSAPPTPISDTTEFRSDTPSQVEKKRALSRLLLADESRESKKRYLSQERGALCTADATKGGRQ